MPKRRRVPDSDEEHRDASSEDGNGGSGDEPSTSLRKKDSSKTKGQPKSQKSKIEAHENTTIKGAVHTNSEGDKYVDLGKKRRAVVRSFKGTALLDIREYYGTEGEEKPGKKGISLQLEQWKNLRESSSTIDELFEKLKK